MEDKKMNIFVTSISGIGVVTYTDPITGEKTNVEVKQSTYLNPAKDVDLPGIDVENKLKNDLIIEINNYLKEKELLSIVTYAKSVGATHNIKVEKTDDVFDVTIKKSITKFLGEPIFVTNAKVAIYLDDYLIDKPESQQSVDIHVYFCGKMPIIVDGKSVFVNIYCDAMRPFSDTHTIIYDEQNPKNSLYVNYENIELI